MADIERRVLELSFEGTRSTMVNLPESVSARNLPALASLDLRSCNSLASLPGRLRDLKGLIHSPSSIWRAAARWCVYQTGSAILRGSPSSICSAVARSSLVSLLNRIGGLKGLAKLDLTGCSSLVALPDQLGDLTGLTTLSL